MEARCEEILYSDPDDGGSTFLQNVGSYKSRVT
jgi:hypothetical protein